MMNSEKKIIKVFQGLEKNRGLSIWIYDNVESLPKRCKDWKTMERNGCIEYHGPCAIAFWDWLSKNPSVNNWETITQDKRIKLKNQEVLGRIQMKVLNTKPEVVKSITPVFNPPSDGSLNFFKPQENNAPPF